MTAGQRLQRIRELRGLPQIKLATRVGVGQPALSRWERDQRPIDADVLPRLATELGFPEAYFDHGVALQEANRPPLSSDTLRYRARAGASTRELTQARRWGETVVTQSQRMLEQLRPIPVALPRAAGASPVDAARDLRTVLGLTPLQPVPYLVVAVERLGVQVVGLPFTSSRQDAFAGWAGASPILGLLANVPGDRLRFSVAHEIGHLMLHDAARDQATAEAEADEFAAELLAPLDGMRLHLPGRVTLASLMPLKSVWGVSLRTLIRQAKRTGRIDQERYTSLFRQISARGWTKIEPAPVSVEKPRAFRKMAELLYGDDTETARKLSEDAAWPVDFTAAVLERHARRTELPRASRAPSTGNVVAFPAPRRLKRHA